MAPERPADSLPSAPARAVLDPVRNLKVYLTALFSLLALCVALTAAATYISLRAHYLRQQQSELQRSQDFIQLRNELIKPFQLSRWMSRDAFLMDWLGKGEREPGRVLSYLKEISARTGRSRPSSLRISPGNIIFPMAPPRHWTRETPDVGWFFQLLERRVESLADVGYDNGDKSKPFLYIDIRMPDLHGTTSAYVGAAVELQHFQSLLAAYRQQHGDELHFVNQDRMVVLSTTPGNVNTPADPYHWYQLTSTLPHAHESGQEKAVAFLDRQGRHFSISREWLEDLGWHVYTGAGSAGHSVQRGPDRPEDPRSHHPADRPDLDRHDLAPAAVPQGPPAGLRPDPDPQGHSAHLLLLQEDPGRQWLLAAAGALPPASIPKRTSATASARTAPGSCTRS